MTEGFFPGSRQPLGPVPGPPRDVLANVKGKTFTVRGREIELFTIGQVAQALNRSPQTLRAWERDHVIPNATYTKPGANGDPRGRRRLYSREQVEVIVAAAEATGILYDLSKRIGGTNFSERVYAGFKELAAK